MFLFSRCAGLIDGLKVTALNVSCLNLKRAKESFKRKKGGCLMRNVCDGNMVNGSILMKVHIT